MNFKRKRLQYKKPLIAGLICLIVLCGLYLGRGHFQKEIVPVDSDKDQVGGMPRSATVAGVLSPWMSKTGTTKEDILPKVQVGGEKLADAYVAGFVSATAIKEGKSDLDFSLFTDQVGMKLDAWGYDYVRDGDNFFIFYYQDDGSPWSDMIHGNYTTKTVAQSGCGSVCLSMVLTALTGDIESYSPDKIVDCEVNDHVAAPNKSVRSIPVLCEVLESGCTATYYEGGLDLDLVDKTLAEGGYIILDQKAKVKKSTNWKVFGAKNHYIVIRGGNQTDGYLIANPLWGYSKPDSIAQYAPQNSNVIPASLLFAKYWYTVVKD